jgi:hypothetical protein
MPGLTQMEKYTCQVQIGRRPNEQIKVEKLTLGVAYSSLSAASIDYQSTFFNGLKFTSKH